MCVAIRPTLQSFLKYKFCRVFKRHKNGRPLIIFVAWKNQSTVSSCNDSYSITLKMPSGVSGTPVFGASEDCIVSDCVNTDIGKYLKWLILKDCPSHIFVCDKMVGLRN